MSTGKKASNPPSPGEKPSAPPAPPAVHARLEALWQEKQTQDKEERG